MEKHNSDWITGGPWYNTSIFFKEHGKVFVEIIINARTEIYNLICSIDSHETNNPSEHDDGSINDGFPVPLNPTIEALFFLSATIYFVGFFL